MNNEIEKKIEAILFYKGEPVEIKEISNFLCYPVSEIETALDSLEKKLNDGSRGVVIVRNENHISLGTSPDTSPIIEKLTEEEFNKELSKVSLETLSIITYKGPISKREIDYIRGVNSGYIIRNLLIRGLIEKITDNKERGYLYKPSLSFISHLGITNISDLPKRDEIISELETFVKKENQNEDN